MAEYFALFPVAGKGIYGGVDDAGVVTFAIEAGPDSPIRGTEMFNRMMDHFGERAKTIHGNWNKSVQGKPSTNIDKVNDLVPQGISLDKAVLEAWTVTRARKRGFSVVTVLHAVKDRDGTYIKIEVLISR